MARPRFHVYFFIHAITDYYLPDGLSGMKAHNAAALITKHTLAFPGDEGKQLWEETLDLFFCGDRELIDYVQKSPIYVRNEDRITAHFSPVSYRF